MALFTIADPHLSLAKPKPMDVFGGRWQGHTERFVKGWKAVVDEEDTVLVGGDISWGISLAEAGPDLALIDGNREKDFGVPCKTVIHGDSLSASIAAASVLAKVTRDDVMTEMATQYPQYGFEIHKGYGTKAHYEALRTYGHCPLHRVTFLKKFYGDK